MITTDKLAADVLEMDPLHLYCDIYCIMLNPVASTGV